MPSETTIPLELSSVVRLASTKDGLVTRRHFLVVVSGPDASKRVPLEGTVTVGSHVDCTLTLTDETTSRYHLEVQVRAAGIFVKDLGSTNGTRLGGVRVQEAVVEADALIELGKTVLRVSVDDQPVRQPPAHPGDSFGGAKGGSPAMLRLFSVLSQIAPTDATVVLLGETGTGKEVLAHAVHEHSARKKKPFVVVDCSTLAPTLIESELFGHVRGAFTGAVADRKGAFEEADGGTLFLDEVGELPLELQPRLLRALESGTVKRLGGNATSHVDVRLVAATHRDLEAAVKAGSFRRDLYFRLAVVTAWVPPLRERLEDLPLLFRHLAAALGKPDLPLTDEVSKQLRRYDWPGNVRELRNAVERLAAGRPLFDAAPPASRPLSGDDLSDLPYHDAKDRVVDAFTREYLDALLEKCGRNISEVARTSGISRAYVHRLVAKYGLKASDG